MGYHDFPPLLKIMGPEPPYFFDEVEMMGSIIIGYIGDEALTLGLSGVGCITSTMSHRNCKNGNIP